MNFFKKKNSQTNSKLTKPDIEKLLQEAYQANPKCYEKRRWYTFDRACAYRRYRFSFSQSCRRSSGQ